MIKKYTYKKVLQLIKSEKLPSDFKQWDLAQEIGWTVAHEAAVRGRLPEDFNQWDIIDCDGDTVAHIAAMFGGIPASFDQWDMVNSSGATVGSIAIANGRLTEEEYAGWKICSKLDWNADSDANDHDML
jgi:hypothetical protein